MRYDIKELQFFEITKQMNKDNIKPVYSKVARQYNCDYRTVKTQINGEYIEKEKRVKKSKLDTYKEFVETKLRDSCSYISIYEAIRKIGYIGKYTTARNYCSKFEKSEKNKATIRFETLMGEQAQLDWKEDYVLTSKDGIEYKEL